MVDQGATLRVRMPPPRVWAMKDSADDVSTSSRKGVSSALGKAPAVPYPGLGPIDVARRLPTRSIRLHVRMPTPEHLSSRTGASIMELCIFLVEDNRQIRDNLIPALTDLGLAEVVGVAESESEATHWLSQHEHAWDIAVVDLFLKEGSGLGVLHWVRTRRRPKQRVVVLSNYATPAMRELSRERSGRCVRQVDRARRILRLLPERKPASCRLLAGGAASPTGSRTQTKADGCRCSRQGRFPKCRLAAAKHAGSQPRCCPTATPFVARIRSRRTTTRLCRTVL
ncbi:CheY-like chemotaxis protein [Variovorax boronicumulans]|nr:CheY-like chemotaxis protein [Variovorax boronicumulans]